MENNSDSGASAPIDNSTQNEVVDNQNDNAQENGEQNAQSNQQALEKKLIKKLKLKVDGQEFEEDLPFEVDENNKEQLEYIKRHLQMSKSATKRMQEAAKLKQQAEHFVKMLQEDPMKILTHKNFGGEEKFRKMAEEYIARQINEQMLTPEQRQQRDMEDRLRKYEEQEKQSKQQQEQEQVVKLQAHYADEYSKVIEAGLKSQNIPKTPRTVKRMAELMSKNLKHGLELQPEHLAQLVKEDYINEMKEMFGASEGDILLNLLGEDVSNKIRKADLAKLKASGINVNRQVSQNKSNQSSAEPKNMSRDEWREMIDKRSKE